VRPPSKRYGEKPVHRWAAVLLARGLRKDYGTVQAVRGVDLEVARGRIVGLVGNNGAGKTTTIKLLAGLLEPTQGSVRIDGADPLQAAVRAKVGFVPEESPLYDDMTPEAYLVFFAALYGVPRVEALGRARGLLQRLRLDEAFRKTPIGKLSKGSARKVALARALLHDPPVLILDEPTSGLDPATQRVLDSFLLELRGAGKAILLSAHDLSQVERLSDEVVVMHEGRVVLRGSPAELRGAGGPTQYRVRASVPFAGSAPDGPDHAALVADWPAVEVILDAVRAAGGRVLDVAAESPRLADVLAQVGRAPEA
jgi:ABC-2 type transport system ATP-binding protein